MSLTIDLQGHALELLPEGAAFDPVRRVLFVSDLHLGKTAIFRDAGLPLPSGPDAATLQRLSLLLQRVRASTLVVLGDVFHARSPSLQQTISMLAAWRSRNPDLQWKIVPGNHDRRVPWDLWLPGAELFCEGEHLGPWSLAHVPREESGSSPSLAGHLHPGVRFGPARQKKITLPCFWHRRGTLVLPAFGDFTGIKCITRLDGDQVWALLGSQVAKIP